MSLDPSQPREYLVGHVEDALARDARVTEQGLHVTITGDDPPVVTVSGTVVSAHHQRGLAEVIGELLPGAELRDQTAVVDRTEHTDAEEMP